MGIGGCLIFATVNLVTGKALLPRDLLHPVTLIRNTGELIGSFGFMTALALTPISSATSILQALPLVVTLMAAVFLGEYVGWRRWNAIALGFIGVLLIVRPGADSFEPASLFAVLGVLGFATRDLTTRIAPPTLSATQLAQWGMTMLIPLGAVLLLRADAAQPLTSDSAWILLGALTFGVIANFFVIHALKSGSVSAVIPFRYTQLIFAMLLGITIFGERPDPLTLTGAMLIICSGLYALARERALSSKARQGY